MSTNLSSCYNVQEPPSTVVLKTYFMSTNLRSCYNVQKPPSTVLLRTYSMSTSLRSCYNVQKPPSTGKIVPVIIADSSLSRNIVAFTTSSVFWSPRNGTVSVYHFWTSDLLCDVFDVICVNTKPGLTLFTRIWFGPSSTAMFLVSISRAALEMLYIEKLGAGCNPATLDMLTMLPPCRRSTICFATICDILNAAFKLMSNKLSSWPLVMSKKGSSNSTPALFTRKSTGPMFSTTDLVLSQLAISTLYTFISGISVLRLSRSDWVLLIAWTSQPLLARLRAIARPIPLPAPVTIARFRWKFDILIVQSP